MCALWNDADAEDATTKRKQVHENLGVILDQRVKLNLVFDEAAAGIKDLSATLVDYNDLGVTVEATSLEGATSSWEGRGVSCYIMLQGQESEGGGQLLTFSSTVRSMKKGSGGVVLLVLTLPDSIKSAQRRRSVRVMVDETKVPLIKLWNELPPGVIIATRTPLLNSERDAKRGMRLSNISAKGLGLLVPKAMMQKALVGLRKGADFSIYFTASSQAKSPATTFWVNATLRNILESKTKDEVGLGFEFVAEGGLNEHNKLVWCPLKLDEVSGLGKFIFKWNLDYYREKLANE